MNMRIRAILTLVLPAAILGLASCDHYVCGSGANFSGTSCAATTPGLGSSGSSGSANAAFVFVADASGASAGTTSTTGLIDGYTLDTTASTFSPTASYTAPTTPLGDGGVGMVVAQSQFLYTGFGSTNTIYGWQIGSAGTLTALSGSPYTAPFMDLVPSGFGSQSIITNPAGTLLFFSDALNKIYVYQISSTGALTAASGSPFSVPFGGNLATDGLGSYLYITETQGNHTGSEVAAYVIGSTGSLTAVPGSPFAYPMWQVQGDPTGKFLIGTTGNSAAAGLSGVDDDHLYVFNITQSGSAAGAIAPVSGSPFPTTNSPLSIAVQPNTSGNLVYSFGVADSSLAFNPVEGYELSSTGTLTAVNGSPFTSAALGDEAEFDQSGAFLFVYGGIINQSTNTVTYQMSSLDVASGGALSQPTSTLALPAGGFFAVTDPQQ